MPDVLEVTCVCIDFPQYAISAEDECATLSDGFKGLILTHITKLIEQQINPFGLQAWRQFGNVPLIMVPWSDELMVYAAELRSDRGARSLKISVMFGGARSRGYLGLDGTWDGSDESLWRDVIEPRCRLHFES